MLLRVTLCINWRYRQNNTECVTTDRITQRANVRGHTEHIEQDNAILKHHLIELQQQLREAGVEPKPPPQYIALQNLHQQQWSQAGGGSKGGRRVGSEANVFAQPTVGFQNCDGDRYGGVLSANSYLSHIKGTSLSVFGMEVDLADYISDEEDAPMSYAAMMTSITSAAPNMTPPEKARLPENLAECQTLANTYLVVLNPWMPALHKPDFLRLVSCSFYTVRSSSDESANRSTISIDRDFSQRAPTSRLFKWCLPYSNTKM